MFRLRSCILFNRMALFLKRIPLVRKLLPDSVYSFGDIKLFLAVFSLLGKIIRKLFSVSLYLLIICVLLVVAESFSNSDFYFFASVAMMMLCGLSLLTGSRMKLVFTDSDEDKYTFIKLMRTPVKQYLLADFWCSHLGNAAAFLAVLLPICLFCRLPICWGLFFPFYLLVSHCLADALELFLFANCRCYQKVRIPLQITLVVLGIAVAYLSLFCAREGNTAGALLMAFVDGLFSFPAFLGAVFLFVLMIFYLIRYDQYRDFFRENFKTENLLKTPSSDTQMEFDAVRLQEKDVDVNTEQFAHKTGFDYLHTLFYARHKRLYIRPFVVRLLIVAVVTVFVLGVIVMLPDQAETIGTFFIGTRALPVFVFVMYVISLGDQICKAMFLNCDISLLRYPFYRKKNVLLDTFRMRLWSIMRLNLLLGLSICGASWILVLASGVQLQWMDLCLFCLSILLLAVCFSVHHLFLYYVFQPYTTDLAEKNPFSVASMAVSQSCAICVLIWIWCQNTLSGLCWR